MAGKRIKVFDLRPGEWGTLVLFGSVIAANMFSLEITFVIATGGFLDQIGQRQLPLLWLVDMLAILGGTLLYSFVIDRWNRRRLLQGLLLGAALLYLGGWGLFQIAAPDWLTYPLLYLMAEQQLMLLPIVFWTLANDVYSVAQAKRLFPMLAAVGVLSGVLGNSAAAGAAVLLDRFSLATHDLLTLNALVLLVSFIIFRAAKSLLGPGGREDKSNLPDWGAVKEGWEFVRDVPSFRYLMIAMLGVGFTLTIVEYHFLALSSQAFHGAEFQTFFGFFRAAQTLLIVFMQWALAKKLIDRLGLKQVFTLLPMVSLGFVLALLLGAGLIGVLIARLLGRVFLFGLDEPARKSMQGLIPDERRGRVSAFLDGYLYASGTIAAALLMMALFGAGQLGWLAENLYAWIYLGLGLVVAAVSLWAALRLRSTYDKSMLNWRLARRKRRTSNLDLDF